MKKILILAPHTDDAEFGCGAAIAKWIREGKEVRVIAYSHVDDSKLWQEMVDAMKELKVKDFEILDYPTRDFLSRRQDILESMVKEDKKFKPDLVVCPATTDKHQDHQVIAQEAFRAFKKHSIIGYDMPWNNPTFTTSLFVELTEADICKQTLALDNYESQKEKIYAREDYIWGLARVRGAMIDREFAEAFEIVRWII